MVWKIFMGVLGIAVGLEGDGVDGALEKPQV